jgi:tetratricopeptide (TPR) repeat protein
MPKRSIRDWCLSLAGRGEARAGLAAVAARPVYVPTAWFEQGWKLIAAANREELGSLIAGADNSQDPAQIACLKAGLAYLQGDPRAAEAHAAAALASRPDFAQAYVQRGRALRAQGRHRAALEDFARATGLVPDDAQALSDQAQEHLVLDERADAFDCYQLAVAHAPDCAAALLGLARMLRDSGDAPAALAKIRHAIRVSPLDAEIHFESALLHSQCGDVPGAIAAYERGLELEPANFAACANLGLMYLSRVGDPQLAQRYFERALALDPSSIETQANLGLALEEQGRVDAALAHYDKLIAAWPAVNEYRWNRGLALLANGDYARGWDDYEMRNARGRGTGERVFPFPAWRGEELRPGASLLVFAEQGLGDEIMFASCLPDLLVRGINCVIECDVRLAKLFARSFPAAKVHGAARDGNRRWLADYPRIEAQCGIGSLPRWLRRGVTEFPAHAGFLKADADRVAQWRARLAHVAAKSKVGISWRGGNPSTRGDLRSVPPHQLAPMFEMQRVTFVNLQHDVRDALAEFTALRCATMVNFADALNDIEELAALLAALDHIVTVDNSVAHLAGALGCKTRIMLAHSADWRWLRAGVTCTWYPSVALIRQRVPGDWTSVVAEIAGELGLVQ